MLIVLSPAKTLDFETPPVVDVHSKPDFLADSRVLINQLRELSPADLGSLMSISDTLSALNVARFSSWKTPFTPKNAKQAMLAFAGDVYEGLNAVSLDAGQLEWAQHRVRMLSGLYGLLRPLDLIQPYRLEMGTRLANERGKDLYAFWGDKLAREINKQLADEQRTGASKPVLVNLASDEYFRALPMKSLKFPVVQPIFHEPKAGGWKVISFQAKRARGLMTRFAIENRIEDPQQLKEFDLAGYRFEPNASNESSWVFRRVHAA